MNTEKTLWQRFVEETNITEIMRDTVREIAIGLSASFVIGILMVTWLLEWW